MFNAVVRFVRGMLVLALLGGLIAAAAWYRDLWLPLRQRPAEDRSTVADGGVAGDDEPVA